MKKIIEVCRRNNIEITGSVFKKKMSRSIDYLKDMLCYFWIHLVNLKKRLII